MLMPDLPDAVFIDLFSGSGGIGIEALSRGARKAYFVENSPKAVACITENLEHTHLADKAVVLKQDVLAALRGNIRDTLIVVEASAAASFDYVETLGFVVEKIKQYKTNKHVFIRRNTQ